MKKVLLTMLLVLYASMPLLATEQEIVQVCNLETKELCEYNVVSGELNCFEKLCK